MPSGKMLPGKLPPGKLIPNPSPLPHPTPIEIFVIFLSFLIFMAFTVHQSNLFFIQFNFSNISNNLFILYFSIDFRVFY